MNAFIHIIRISFTYMTRLNIHINQQVTDTDVSKTSMFFWITSLFVGGIMCAIFFIFHKIGLEFFAIIAAIFSSTLITGALHVDGFIDCADAFFVSNSKQRALDILKDSHVGAYGIIACVFLYLAQFSLLYELMKVNQNIYKILLMMPVSAKFPMLLCAYLSSYPRENGSGKSIITLMQPSHLIISLLTISLLMVLFFGITSFIIIAVLAVLGLFYTMLCKAKLGGATGDVLGSINESAKLAFLFMIYVIQHFGGNLFWIFIL